MSRKIAAFITLAILIGWSICAEEIMSIVGDIGLLDSPQFEGPQPPARLSLGVKMVQGALYKLRDKENIVSAGLLRQGFNVISIEAGHLFESSGTHAYELELLVNSRIFHETIELRIRIDYGTVASAVVPVSRGLDREYRLSLYVDDKLMSSSLRKHYEKFPLQLEMPDIPKVHVPFDPNKRDDPMANSFSILDAAALAYKLIKGQVQKDQEKQGTQDPLRLWKQRTANFIQTDSQAATKEIKAVITLQIL